MSRTALLRLRTLGLGLVASFASAAAVSAQTAPTPATSVRSAAAAGPEVQEQKKAPPRRPAKRIPPPPARVTVIPSQPPVRPQVVTVVHRLSGLKVLRLMLRQAGENGVVETIDPETITNDAHASVIAGWAFEDGKTIATRLPQAAAEIEITQFESFFPEQKARVTATTPFPLARARVEPDLTVITSDGRKLRARLIGLDAETGLSVLQVIGGLAPSSPPPQEIARKLVQGQPVQIFAPEPTTPDGEVVSRITYVKVGKIDATVSNVAPSSPGVLEKLTVRGATFSPAVMGGVVCDGAGNTVGMVESIEGNNARILGANTIRAATQRVLKHQASVPRPLLGVRGEPVEFAARAAFLANGWHENQLKDLINAQVGILLTTVVPRTPAALAKLQAGDVIVRVNQNEVKTAEEFSRLLGEAGSGEQVQFTIKRPDAPAPISIPVTLGRSFSPMVEWQFELPRVATPFFGLQALGIETMALTPQAAAKLGALRGSIVVAIEPESAAARGGLREGDVIESIDGRIAGRGVWIARASTAQKKHTLAIVRDGEKKKIVVDVED